MPPGLWSQVPRLSLQEVAPEPPPRPAATPSEPPWLRQDEPGSRWRLWGGRKDRCGGIKKGFKMSLRCCLREHDPVPESRCAGPGGEAPRPAACGWLHPNPEHLGVGGS